MKIHFCGAAGTTTGSQHLLEVNGCRILLDCGMYQGRREEAWHINKDFPYFSPAGVDAVVLSHAHIDHSGNLPNLVKQGFQGNIYSTFATRDLCQLMLADAAQGELAPPQTLEIDMGRPVNVAAVIYTPRRDSATGTVDRYAVYLSMDGNTWGAPAAEGEFSNIRANPVPQRIDLKAPVKARYLRFVGKRVVEGSHVAVAELGVLGK